ncbi:42722_t:CDS:2, partial [Gigaspora margarita]
NKTAHTKNAKREQNPPTEINNTESDNAEKEAKNKHNLRKHYDDTEDNSTKQICSPNPNDALKALNEEN